MIRKLALIGAVSALALGMAGCDDDDDVVAVATPPAFLSGTAAVGAAMASSPVVVNCAGTTTNLTTTTNASGGYSIAAAAATEAGAVLPCAVKVTFNAVDYFSLVRTGAKANVTPLTNLVVARALAQAGVAGTPAAWFTGGADMTSVTATHVTNATNAVKAALEAAATGTDTVTFDLFTGTLVPGSTSDLYDTWLESFQTAVGAGYATLVTNFATNGTISGITITLPELPGAGTGTMTMVTSVMGIASAPVTVTGVTIPTDMSMFCAAGAYYNSAAYAAAGVTNLQCSFANNTGTVSGTITQPVIGAVSWVTRFTWTAG